MLIHGLQKMTLLDYPGKVACTVFLAGCDFRCPFCHNSELIGNGIEAVTDDDGLLEFLSKRKGLLDGVVFTGGEPMLTKGLPELFEKIKKLGYPVKCDTNGNHPEVLKELLDRKLVDYVAMDIKNSDEKYAATIGFESFDIGNVRKSISLIMSRAEDYEFRTTVVDELHDENSFAGIGKLIEGAKKYYLQPFADRDTVMFSGLSAPSEEKLKKYAEIMKKYVSEVYIRGVEQ